MQYILRKVCETTNKSYTFPCKKCFVRISLFEKHGFVVHAIFPLMWKKNRFVKYL